MPHNTDHPPKTSTNPAHDWLLALTQIPTAAGREHRVIRWIENWVAQRPDLALSTDAAGNLIIQPREPWGDHAAHARPIYITAHLDHPAFVVERIVSPSAVEVSFRGGVMDVFFESAPITLYTADDRPFAATLVEVTNPDNPIAKTYLAELDADNTADQFTVGDVGTWALPPARIDDNNHLHTHACDDLAALAAAIAAYEHLRELNAQNPGQGEDVRLLFTRAEEIGFVGAIAACKHNTIPQGARLIALENSRSFPDSPIGGGPIVRVGDRISVFSPVLTAAIAKRAEDITGKPAQPRATETQGTTARAGTPQGATARGSTPQGATARAGTPQGATARGGTPPRSSASAQGTPGQHLASSAPSAPSLPRSKAPHRWQRKLMAGGACEASVFCAYGYEATCLCLPLGNYHNMPHLTELQAGTYDAKTQGPPRCAPEYISLDDFDGLVDLLVAIGTNLPAADPFLARAENLYKERSHILD